MNYEQSLIWSTKFLKSHSILTARLDSLILLEDCLGINRSKILSEPKTKIDSLRLDQFRNLVERRAKHEPMAYIRNKVEFYGREFYIDQRVLTPRPESETIIDQLNQRLSATHLNKPTIIDIGTGSGNLCITAKLEHPHALVIACDNSADALVVAKQNANHYQAAISFYIGDLIDALPDKSLLKDSIIIANLPYIPNNFEINQAAQFEPTNALFAGQDGLDRYQDLFRQLSKYTDYRPLYVLVEALPEQHLKLSLIAAQYDFQLIQIDDFIQIFS